MIDTSEVLKYEFQDAWNEKKHSSVLSPEERDISSPSVPVKVHVLSSHWPEFGHMHIPEPITVGKGMDPLWVGLDWGLLPYMQMGGVNSTMTMGTPRRIQVCLG